MARRPRGSLEPRASACVRAPRHRTLAAQGGRGAKVSRSEERVAYSSISSNSRPYVGHRPRPPKSPVQPMRHRSVIHVVFHVHLCLLSFIHIHGIQSQNGGSHGPTWKKNHTKIQHDIKMQHEEKNDNMKTCV